MNDFSKLLRLLVEEGEEIPEVDAGGDAGDESGGVPGGTPTPLPEKTLTIESAKDPMGLFGAYMQTFDPMWNELRSYLTDMAAQLTSAADKMQGTFDYSTAPVKDQGSAGAKKLPGLKGGLQAMRDKLAATRNIYSGDPVTTNELGEKEKFHPSGARQFNPSSGTKNPYGGNE